MIERLVQEANLQLYPRSVAEAAGTTYFLARGPAGKVLGILGDTAGFVGKPRGEVLLCPLAPNNATALRGRLP